MNIEAIREFCLRLPHAQESMPFNDNIVVFKVVDKMFALIDLSSYKLSLKFEPELALKLREQHPFEVAAGFHLCKKYWNTIITDKNISNKLLAEWIIHSYKQTALNLKKDQKEKVLSLLKDLNYI